MCDGYEVSVTQLVTPSRAMAAIFDDRHDRSVWLEAVYAMALVLERIPDDKGARSEQQSIVPVVDYGTGEIFLGPAVEGYVGVIPVQDSHVLPGRCTPRSPPLWRRIEPLLQRSRDESEPLEGKVVDLVKHRLLRFDGGLSRPRPTASRAEMTEARAASLFVSAGRVLCSRRPELRLRPTVDRVSKAYGA